jgi:hypothetical protein
MLAGFSGMKRTIPAKSGNVPLVKLASLSILPKKSSSFFYCQDGTTAADLKADKLTAKAQYARCPLIWYHDTLRVIKHRRQQNALVSFVEQDGLFVFPDELQLSCWGPDCPKTNWAASYLTGYSA